MPVRKRQYANSGQMPAPPSQLTPTAEACLQYAASLVPMPQGLTLSLAKQADQALIWKAAAVHPLQALETAYQDIVHDAGRDERSLDQRRIAEEQAMAEFFVFDGSGPGVLGMPRGGEYRGERFPIVEDRLKLASRALTLIGKEIDASTARNQPLPPGADLQDFQALRHALRAVSRELTTVLASFYTLPGSEFWQEPRLDAARTEIGAAEQDLGAGHIVVAANVRPQDILKPPLKRLKKAAEALEKVFSHSVAAVQMFYAIEPFYLFRLLIRYQIESTEVIPADASRSASSVLTRLITAGNPQLSVWLRDKIVELDQALKAVDPGGDTLFFLKGGRALAYVEGHPGNGKNDWDTQIVINPLLSAAEWYALFETVQNTVLLSLQRFKRELYQLLGRQTNVFELGLYNESYRLLQEKQAQFTAWQDIGLSTPIDADAPISEDENVPERHRVNTKAELIDVGLPRRDTVEGLEQWIHLRNHVNLAPDGVPVPGVIYYIDEYLTMLREVFAGVSPSLRKAGERTERFCHILTSGSDDLNALLDGARHDVADDLPLSLAAIQAQPAGAARNALLFILAQFKAAYALRLDQNLAGCFDAFFAAGIATMQGDVNLPVELATALDPDRVPEDYPDRAARQVFLQSCRQLAITIGYAQRVSQAMAYQFQARGAFMKQNEVTLGGIVRTLFTDLFQSAKDELEIQLAVAGAFAAKAHADYARFTRPDAIEPVETVNLRLYAHNPWADAPTVMAVLRATVEAFLQDQDPASLQLALDADGPPNMLRLFAVAPVAFNFDGTITNPPPAPPLPPNESLVYQPLVMTVELMIGPPPTPPPPDPGQLTDHPVGHTPWPLLSFIWAYPVLSLRDLILDYRRRAAAIMEFGVRTRLRETAAALSDLLMRAENPEPKPRDINGHLMISSQAMVFGPEADYPPAYFQTDNAIRIVLGSNREAVRNAILNRAPELPRPPLARRTPDLDLLVINQDRGGIEGGGGQFNGWSAQNLADNVVAPLQARDLKARFIVLDFGASASLIETFAPICTGKVFCSLYGAPQPLMNRTMWTRIQPDLGPANAAAIGPAITQRAMNVSCAATGLSHLSRAKTRTDAEITTHLYGFPPDLARHPTDRDVVSAFYYLFQIGEILAIAFPETDQTIRDKLILLRQSTPRENLWPADDAILQAVPTAPTPFNQAAIEQLAIARMTSLLTADQYRINDPPPANASFDAVWTRFKAHRATLVALFRNTSWCPSPFAVFTKGEGAGGTFAYDTALAGHLAPETLLRINTLSLNAAADVTAIQTILGGVVEREVITQIDTPENFLRPA